VRRSQKLQKHQIFIVQGSRSLNVI